MSVTIYFIIRSCFNPFTTFLVSHHDHIENDKVQQHKTGEELHTEKPYASNNYIKEGEMVGTRDNTYIGDMRNTIKILFGTRQRRAHM